MKRCRKSLSFPTYKYCCVKCTSDPSLRMCAAAHEHSGKCQGFESTKTRTTKQGATASKRPLSPVRCGTTSHDVAPEKPGATNATRSSKSADFKRFQSDQAVGREPVLSFPPIAATCAPLSSRLMFFTNSSAQATAPLELLVKEGSGLVATKPAAAA